jgi:CRISPR-associated endonuclease Cas1
LPPNPSTSIYIPLSPSLARPSLEAGNMAKLRTRLVSIAGHFSESYFNQIFRLIPASSRPEPRKTFKAHDGINNLFNSAYEMLSWKVQHALIKAKFEPYLGFLHSMAEGKPSLICDFMELYRYLIDDFVIQYCQGVSKNDFTMKYENHSSNRKGKREFLNDSMTNNLVKGLNKYFQSKVDVSRVRMGKHQEIETIINEEALLFAQYLRNEKQEWIPRVVSLN